ncbi:MAG TPA: hypothetical protein VK619_10415 [Pyrinomonadaceae bacterium]|nr:hypothetical protein [Pyrinomonadaceae bacterium]
MDSSSIKNSHEIHLEWMHDYLFAEKQLIYPLTIQCRTYEEPVNNPPRLRVLSEYVISDYADFLRLRETARRTDFALFTSRARQRDGELFYFKVDALYACCADGRLLNFDLSRESVYDCSNTRFEQLPIRPFWALKAIA